MTAAESIPGESDADLRGSRLKSLCSQGYFIWLHYSPCCSDESRGRRRRSVFAEDKNKHTHTKKKYISRNEVRVWLLLHTHDGGKGQTWHQEWGGVSQVKKTSNKRRLRAGNDRFACKMLRNRRDKQSKR